MALKEKNVFQQPALFWVFPVFAFGLPLLVLSLQPDFGTIVLFTFLALAVVFMLGLKWKYIFASLPVLGLSLLAMALWKPYRLQRIKAFLDPWSDPLESGFQLIQSMISFHSGGLRGVGLGLARGRESSFSCPRHIPILPWPLLERKPDLLGLPFY